jgi:P27 family predicted phage terminase small subunit
VRRIPTHLKLIRGNPSKRPIPAEPEPEIPESVPEPPPFLAPYARDEWWEVGPHLVRLGLLTSIDTQTFAAYCSAYSTWRTAVETLTAMAERDGATRGLLVKRASDGNPMRNPLVRIAADAANDMLRFAGEFGLTPLARSRIGSGGYEPGEIRGVACRMKSPGEASCIGRPPGCSASSLTRRY